MGPWGLQKLQRKLLVFFFVLEQIKPVRLECKYEHIDILAMAPACSRGYQLIFEGKKNFKDKQAIYMEQCVYVSPRSAVEA